MRRHEDFESKRKRNKKRFRGFKHGPHSGDPETHLKGRDPAAPPRLRRQQLHLDDVSRLDDEADPAA